MTVTWTNLQPVDVRLDVVTIRDLRKPRRYLARSARGDIPFEDDTFYGIKAAQLERLRMKFDEFTTAAVHLTEGVGFLPVDAREVFDDVERAVRECQACLEGLLQLGREAEGWRRFSRVGRRRPSIETTVEPYRPKRPQEVATHE